MHDFNNLLGVISNNMHLLQDHVVDADAQEFIESAMRAVADGSQLAQSLQRLSRHRPTQSQRVDLAQDLPGLQCLLRRLLGPRITIAVDVAPDTWHVRVDPRELELTLTHLGLDARDAMPAGGNLRLQAGNAVRTDLDVPPGRWVRLSVTDDSKAISADVATRGLDPFSTVGTAGRGARLGLSQVADFCQQAGGIARMSSAPGHGTTVTLLLPVDRDLQ